MSYYFPRFADTRDPETLRQDMQRWHWKRHFQYLRIEACAKRNDDPDIARYAKGRATYHGNLARALRKPKDRQADATAPPPPPPLPSSPTHPALALPPPPQDTGEDHRST